MVSDAGFTREMANDAGRKQFGGSWKNLDTMGELGFVDRRKAEFKKDGALGKARAILNTIIGPTQFFVDQSGLHDDERQTK